MRRLMILGIVLALVGLVLAVAYWPLTSVSGATLRANQSGSGYLGYAVGARITIHERIDNVSYLGFPSPTTFLSLDSGDPGHPVTVLVQGDARPVVTLGETVYMSATLQEFVGVQYWQVASPSDIHAAWPVDAAFYATLGVGVVLLIADAARSGRKTPEG